MSTNEHSRDAFAYGAAAFAGRQAQPSQRGVLDFVRWPDGVWRQPAAWVAGDTIYFGMDLAQPGSDRTVYWRVGS